MRFKSLLMVLLILTFVGLYGCSQDDVTKSEHAENETKSSEQELATQEILYENTEWDIKVYETSDWMLDKEVTGESFNVTFEKDLLKAIVTIIPNEKSFDEIKQELQVGAGNVSIEEEKEDFLAFKNERKETIRTDIYLKQEGDYTGIISFMTPESDWEINQEKIETFKGNIDLF
ncbi:hypothetical protein [Texcoconibacillus texcoconensis]|uniref:Lipoprotein n=1 Tax=Texcoconibacillus texcoconensis TaxID=1095777 RepID=A0A840QSZ8_9BACI|nr:hypothetical protein [Texcoconibacillus texcoconensis]MBB5174652.1 hypothetical protein [Texcoconibacillus texcoconensis]